MVMYIGINFPRRVMWAEAPYVHTSQCDAHGATQLSCLNEGCISSWY